MPEPHVTILHLSDLQFGKNHRFAGVDLSGLTNPYDSLLERLWDDLQSLRESHGLRPDLVVVTGDLAEWAMPLELQAAREFLEKLTDAEHLDLPRHRVAIVPGNHDVNRKLCQAYFLQNEASGTAVAPPWWPKWQHYSAMFDEFYKDVRGVTFTPDQPWSLFEVPDLNLVVAGLNSTMIEGHDEADDGTCAVRPRHVGHCGERQYRWFAEQLRSHGDRGWLRIGAVHHNQQRGCKDDDENLEDADDLSRILAPSLNLLLHGHTHRADLGWFSPHAPILATGSAALKNEARPSEVPNQYQVLVVSSGTLQRFGRAFRPTEKTFGPDPSVGSPDGLHEESVSFERVSAALAGSTAGTEVEGARDEGDDEPHRTGPGSRRDLHVEPDVRDDFVSRVAEVCRFRRPAAAITRVAPVDRDLRYLRVVEKSDGIVRSYPLGVFEHGFGRDDLERFLAAVDAPYRSGDSGLISEIVFSGDRPSSDVVREAERRRVRLQSFVEYQGLIDFAPYVQKQTERLASDTIYPPSLYVPQRMRFHVGEEVHHVENALAQVEEWLLEPRPRFVLILGDFGTGKTFLLHELARRMGADGTGLVPLFVELRALEKAQSLDALMAQHLARSGVDLIDLRAFRYMLQQGRVVLFFDGFDELALRVSYDRAAEHFETLVQAAAGDAKVVVTSRTQHFETDKQVRTVLFDRAQPLPGLRYCKLQPFTEAQIKVFLQHKWNDETEAAHWFELLKHVKDLLGLSENPRMLGFITELKKSDLARAARNDGAISAADLYRLLLERWLVFEYERAHPKGAQEILPQEARWAAVTAVALRLWEKTEKFVSTAEIAEVASTAVAKAMTTPPPADIAGHMIGSGSLLRRDDEGCFFFVHQSVMEWLVARRAAEDLKAGASSTLLEGRAMSPLMVEFLCDLATADVARRWAVDVIEEVKTGQSVGKTNALAILGRLGVHATLNLAGQDLRGRSFEGQSLVDADLSGANLAGVRLIGKDLSGAKLDAACLAGADLSRCVLANASLEHADLTGARLLQANLEGTKLAGASLRRAVLSGSRRQTSFPDDCDLTGAALPDDRRATPCLAPPLASSYCAAWHPTLDVLASGHADGSVRLWDAASGKALSTLSGHQASVLSVAFSPDGRSLASASDDKTVRLWDVASGRCVAILAGLPEGWVAFTPEGRYKLGGNVAGSFWHAIALCRLEAGELDRVIPGLRMGLDEPFLDTSRPL